MKALCGHGYKVPLHIFAAKAPRRGKVLALCSAIFTPEKPRYSF